MLRRLRLHPEASSFVGAVVSGDAPGAVRSDSSFTLCVDEAFPGFNQRGRGERLFGEDGKPTPYVNNVLEFLQQYQFEFRRTQRFCKKLKDLNLLEPMQAQIKLSSGARMALQGFSVVDRARLKTLSANELAELVKSDELELIYTHLVSVRNFTTVRDRLGQAQPAHTTGGNSGSPTAPPAEP